MAKVLLWHLGLGDAIICAGLVNKLAETHVIIVPCYEHNEKSIRSIFSKNRQVKIEVLHGDVGRCYTELEQKYDTIKIGQYAQDSKKLPWYEKFYFDAKVDYEERYKFDFSTEFTQKIIDENYILVCNIGSVGEFELQHIDSTLQVIKPYRSNTILAYIEHIRKATEIHCIDSAFLHLVEQTETSGKLFYHKYARPESCDFKFKKNWTVYE